TATGDAPPPPATGLVAAYSFNQGSGTSVPDVSGTGNNGTIFGATWTTAGRYGSALTFNGTSSYVSVPDALSLHLSNALTVEAWARPSALGSTSRTVVLKERSQNLAWALYASNDTVTPSGDVFTSADYETRGTGALALNAWTHLAVPYD